MLTEEAVVCSASADGPEHFAIVVDVGEAVFNKLDGSLLVSVELMAAQVKEASLENVLRLAHPSLSRFPGALARSPQDGRLWLLAQLAPDAHVDDLFDVVFKANNRNMRLVEGYISTPDLTKRSSRASSKGREWMTMKWVTP